mmetsp:Transcript_24384/g.57796  ORF Transcript_24384/g.57796 Transcript_24384/m.57796 type:complete len:223 (+) Transcript_24384:3984-4652(+)
MSARACRTWSATSARSLGPWATRAMSDSCGRRLRRWLRARRLPATRRRLRAERCQWQRTFSCGPPRTPMCPAPLGAASLGNTAAQVPQRTRPRTAETGRPMAFHWQRRSASSELRCCARGSALRRPCPSSGARSRSCRRQELLQAQRRRLRFGHTSALRCSPWIACRRPLTATSVLSHWTPACMSALPTWQRFMPTSTRGTKHWSTSPRPWRLSRRTPPTPC